MKLYVRQMAWLHAVPKPHEHAKRAKAHNLPKISREKALRKDGVPIRMPPNPAPLIINRLVEIGLTESNGMGPVPLSWREINEWQKAVSVTLAPWEAKLIRELSVAYVAEGRKAEDENCPAPWRSEVTEEELAATEAKLRLVLG